MKETIIANVSKDSHPDELPNGGGKMPRGLPKAPINPPKGVSYVDEPLAVKRARIAALNAARRAPSSLGRNYSNDPPEGIGRGTIPSGGVKTR